MKKLFLGLSAAVIVSTSIFTFAGCEKEEETQTAVQNIEKATIYDLLNAENVHNNALSNIYCTLTENQNLPIQKEQLKILAINHFTDYMVNTYNIPEYYITNVLFNMLPDTNIDNITNNIEDPNYRIALYSIFNIFQTESLTYHELDAALTTIEQNYINSSFNNQIAIINDVFRQSYIYWNENFENWSNLLSEPENTGLCYGWVQFKKVIKGDVSGAITGGISGASFAGVGAVAGALIGAPIGSACAGIDLALDSATVRADRARIKQNN